jgi:murein L,D-transpeptidase YafK
MRKAAFILLLIFQGFSFSACAGDTDLTLSPGAVADRVVVEKTKRQLTLFARGNILKVYRISLGRQPIGPKECEGDNKTPEGNYVIDYHKRDSNFHRALHISYPARKDLEQAGNKGGSPGGDIMIHGLRNGCGWLGELHQYVDWTGGCIAVTDQEIEEIWRVVPDGTPIEIRP